MWTPETVNAPTTEEIEPAAAFLEARHGLHAADVADFLATHHGLMGSAERYWAWNAVARRIRKRADERIAGDGNDNETMCAHHGGP